VDRERSLPASAQAGSMEIAVIVHPAPAPSNDDAWSAPPPTRLGPLGRPAAAMKSPTHRERRTVAVDLVDHRRRHHRLDGGGRLPKLRRGCHERARGRRAGSELRRSGLGHGDDRFGLGPAGRSGPARAAGFQVRNDPVARIRGLGVGRRGGELEVPARGVAEIFGEGRVRTGDGTKSAQGNHTGSHRHLPNDGKSRANRTRNGPMPRIWRARIRARLSEERPGQCAAKCLFPETTTVHLRGHSVT
jgi:hypothetical protein